MSKVKGKFGENILLDAWLYVAVSKDNDEVTLGMSGEVVDR